MGQGKVTAVILAAGQGTRMGSPMQKQYMQVAGMPLVCHGLQAFEESMVDGIVLVVGKGEVDYCSREILGPYGFQKVEAIVEGGKERYHSVYQGLKAASGCSHVLIHDGARPCVTRKIIHDAIEGARRFGACVVGMPVKDTIKMVDGDGFAVETPDRSRLWLVQTPQAFEYEFILSAYKWLLESPDRQVGITDDAMVVEAMAANAAALGKLAAVNGPAAGNLAGKQVKMIAGSYENIKVTTPEDMAVAEAFLSGKSFGKK